MHVALRGGDKSAEEYREALSRAREAATHTSRLVDDLLFVARSEAGAAAALAELLRAVMADPSAFEYAQCS